MPITHSKISQLSNNGDPNLVQPSDWNANHVINGTLDLTGTTGIVGGLIPNSPLVFSATPVFDVSKNASYSMTLTGNVTSSSTTGTPSNGQLLSLTLTEDATGGRTFAFPANFVFSPGFFFATTPLAVNELTFKFDGTNWHLISNGGGGGSNSLIPNTPLAFSATPVFGVTQNVSYSMTLTGNVTSSSTSGSPVNGQLLSLTLTEDATGGRTFVFPASFVFPPSFSFLTTASAINELTFKFDGTNWHLISNASAGGGGGNPLGNTGDLQLKAGAAFGASSINDNNNLVKVGHTTSFAGPDPVVDIKSYGAYVNFSQTTAITNGTTSVTLASAQNFLNGEYVTIYNAGSACGLSTPSAPTITPSVNLGGAFNTGASTASSNSNAYKIVAVSTTDCFTVASASGSTTTASTLGLVGFIGTTFSVSNSTVTVTTSSAHSFVTGQMVHIGYASTSNPLFEGWFAVSSVPDSTHFTYTFPADTRVNAPTSGTGAAFASCTVTNTSLTNNIATITCANSFAFGQNIPLIISGTTNGGGIFNGSFQANDGTVTGTTIQFYLAHANVTSAADSGTLSIPNVWGFNVNHLSWPAVTNAFKYLIYGRDSGNFNLIGQSMVNQWNDYGFNMENGQTFSPWMSTIAPVSSGNNHLTAQIVSGGGTTTLTLSVAAGTSASGQTILSDDGPALIAALNAAKGQNRTCAPVLISNATGAGTFGINIASFTDTLNTNCPAGTLLIQSEVGLQNTLKIGGLALKGIGGTNAAPLAFGQLSNGPNITIQNFPGIWMFQPTGGARLENLTIIDFGSNGTNGILDVFDQGLFTTFSYVNWVHQSPGPLSMALMINLQGANNSGFTYKFDHNNFDGGYYFSTSGLMGLAPFGSMVMTGVGGTSSVGLLQVENSWFVNKGGFDFEQTNPQGGSTFILKDVSTESHTYPILVMSGGSLTQPISNTIDFDGTFIADTPTALFAILGNAFLANGAVRAGGGGTGQHPLNTGTPLIGLSQTSVASNNGPQRLFSEEQFGSKNILEGVFNTTQPGPMGMKRFNEMVSISSPFSLTSILPPPATAPTCSVNSGGSIPTGANQFVYAPVWWNNAEGTLSGFSTNCQTTTGNQSITVNWTFIPGVSGYNLYHCSTQSYPNCFAVRTLPSPMYPGTTTSAVITSYAGSTSPSTDAAGGPTTLSNNFVATQQLTLGSTNSGGNTSITMPTATTGRTATMPDASGQIVLDTTIGTLSALTAPMYDNFNRANNPIGTGAPVTWTVPNGSVSVSSNVATGSTGIAINTAVVISPVLNNDQYAEATLTATNSQANGFGVVVRGSNSGANDYICAVLANGVGHQITFLNSGTIVNLASDSNTANIGDVIGCQVQGTTITYFSNGVQILQATDSNLSSGFPGLYFFSTGASFDNFTARNLTQTFPRLNSEADWSASQHFYRAITVGTPSPITGTLTNGTVYTTNLSLSASNLLNAVSGNSGRVAQSTGTLTSGNLAKFDANGNIIDSGVVAITPLSQLTAATTSNSINNGDNAQTWNWALTTAGKTAFRFTENTAATGGNQFLLQAGTIIGSTAIPLNVYNNLSGSQTLAALSVTPTWNTTGVVDAALLVNPTNTASGTGSLLADFQLSSTSQWKVDKAGNTTQLGTSSVGSTPPACTPGTAGGSCLNEGTAPTAGSNYDTLYGDSGQHAATVNNNNTGPMAISRVTCVNVTGVTVSASVTTDQNLMSCTLAANLLNVVGRTLKIWTASIYTTPAASVATLTQKLKLCTVSGCGSGTVITLAAYTSSANAGAVTNNQINTTTYSTTQTSGASSAYEAHGNMVIDLGASPTVADSTFADINASTVGSIDSTGQLFLQVTGAFSVASGSNSWTQRQMLVEVLN